MILYSVSKWRENNASATRRIDDDGKVLKKIPLSLVQVGAYILRTVDRVSYWPSDLNDYYKIFILSQVCKVMVKVMIGTVPNDSYRFWAVLHLEGHV